MSSVQDVQCLCHQLAVPTFSSASPLVSDSLPFPECLSTAPREWVGTCWYHSKVGVHRPANSLKLCSAFGCRGGVRIYYHSSVPCSNTTHTAAAQQRAAPRMARTDRERFSLLWRYWKKNCSFRWMVSQVAVKSLNRERNLRQSMQPIPDNLKKTKQNKKRFQSRNAKSNRFSSISY